MGNRPNSEERLLLDYIHTSDDHEMQAPKIAEHFRGTINSSRVLNLLDSLYTKGLLLKRWPNWYVMTAAAIQDVVGRQKQSTS